MPFGDESGSEEEEVRADEDPEITAGGRKVVHSTAVSANSKLYAYLPPEELELELDPDEIKKVLVPALLTQLRGKACTGFNWIFFQLSVIGTAHTELASAKTSPY